MMSLDRITHGAMMFLRKERFERDWNKKPSHIALR